MKRRKVSGVYAIVNLISGKQYIGSAVDIKKRRGDHFTMLKKGSHHCRHLQNAYNKYGRTRFGFKIIMECQASELVRNEQRHMDGARKNNLYNSCPTAGSFLGIKRTPETIARLSASNSGKKRTQEHCRRMSEARKGISTGPHTEETKARMSEKAKARAADPEERKIRSERAKRQHAEGNVPYRKKMLYKKAVCKVCSEKFYNFRKSNGKLEQRKMCVKCKERYVRPASGGWAHSEESKKAISEASKRMWLYRIK